MNNLYKAIENKYNATLTYIKDEGIMVQGLDTKGNHEWNVFQTTQEAVIWLELMITNNNSFTKEV